MGGGVGNRHHTSEAGNRRADAFTLGPSSRETASLYRRGCVRPIQHITFTSG